MSIFNKRIDRIRINFLINSSYICNLLGFSFPLYFLTFTRRIELKKAILFSLLGIFVFVLCVKNAVNLYSAAQGFRYYCGWIFFAILFSNRSLEVNFENILKVFIIEIIIESIAINTIINVDYLYNNPISVNEYTGLNFITMYFGFYQRPFGFGLNPSVTASAIIILMALTDIKFYSKVFFFGTLSIVLLVSGTGFVLLIVFIFLKTKFKLFTASVGILIYLTVLNSWFQSWNDKLSVNGFLKLMEFKTAQLIRYVDLDYLIFGRENNQFGFGDDIGWTNAVNDMGLIYVLIFCIILLIIALNKHRTNAVILMILSGFHYPLIFNYWGHFIFGYLLTRAIR